MSYEKCIIIGSSEMFNPSSIVGKRNDIAYAVSVHGKPALRQC